MARREITLIIALAAISIFFIVGVYQIQQKGAYSSSKSYNTATEEVISKGKEKEQKTNMKNSDTESIDEENAPEIELPLPSPASKKNKLNPFGYKVGDVIRFGDVEMVVTKSVVNNKIIDITIKGNDSKQPPKLVSIDNNRIIYEVPAVTDVNVAVRDKASVEENPVFSKKEKEIIAIEP